MHACSCLHMVVCVCPPCGGGGASGRAPLAAATAWGEHSSAGTNFSSARQQLRAPGMAASDWGTGAGTGECTPTLSTNNSALFIVPVNRAANGRFSDPAFSLMAGERRALRFRTTDGSACNVEQLRSGLLLESLFSHIP